jgi:GNAT superfamily N-acetyltransferase
MPRVTLFAEYEPSKHGSRLPDGIRTRTATPDDVPALAALRVERGDAGPEDARLNFLRLLEKAEALDAHLLVATVDDRVAAYGTVDRLAWPALPQGWYLGGVIVTPSMRRRGIGARLTAERLDWIATQAPQAYYFVNERNRASIDLHAKHGFREIARDIRVPGLTFTGGVGLLFQADLAAPAKTAAAVK